MEMVDDSTAIPELEDTGWHDATISSTSAPDSMMGFTGATGTITNVHDINDVELSCP